MSSLDSFSSKPARGPQEANKDLQNQQETCHHCGNIHGGSCTTDPVFFFWNPNNPNHKSAPNEVQIAGQWYKWQRRDKMNREMDTRGEVYFELSLLLPAGKYQYKYLVDGEWTYDSTQPFVPDNFGSWNNVLEIFPKKTFKSYTDKKTIKITSVVAVEGLRILGSWDNWVSQTPMIKSYNPLKGCEQKQFQDQLSVVYLKLLPNEEHEFKFKLGKQYIVDQSYPTVKNGMGSINNRIITYSEEITYQATPIAGRTAKHITHKQKDITCRCFEWEKIAVANVDLPYEWLEGHSMETIGEYVYIFGGKSRTDFTNSLIRLPIHNIDNITVEQVMPNPRAFHNMVVYGNKLLIYGGHNNTILHDYYAFNTSEGVWQVAPYISGSYPQKRQKQSCVLYDNLMVFFGGYYCSSDYEYENFFNDIVVLDIEKMNWVESISIKGDPPKGRYGHTASLINSDMYVFGGCTIQKMDSINFNDLWKINLESVNQLKWEQIKVKGQNPKPRHGHTMNVLNNFLIIFGGVTNKNVALDDLVVFDALKTQWIVPIVNGDIPRPRFHHAGVTVHGEYVLFFGGKTKDQRKSQHIYILRPKQMKTNNLFEED